MKQIFTLLLIFSSLCFSQNFWEPVGFQGEEEIFSIGINPTNGYIFIGTGDPNLARVHLSTDNGNTWTETGLGGGGWVNSVESIDINSNGFVFASTGAFLYRSTDNGVTWQNIVGLPSYCCFQATVFNTLNHLFTNAGDTSGVLRSDDNGNTWTLFNQGLSSNKFYDLAIHSDDQIFAAKSGGIYRSNNNGESWSQILSNVEIFSVALNNSGHIFGGKFGGIVRSTNNGNSWALTINFSFSRTSSILILDDGHIFAGSWGEGIFQSTDNGDNWVQVTQGLTNLTVYSLSVSSTGYLFAGTSDGIFRSVQPVTSVTEENNNIPSSYVLRQNYPNPFNPVTKIKFSIPNSEMVQIRVYNMLGNEITTLLNDYKQAGTYETEFNASNLPSGVYFYRIISGSFLETKKMLLLR